MKQLIFITILASSLLLGCASDTQTEQNQQADLTIYSGLTMLQPLTILAKEFEEQHKVKIEIKRGASGYLYETLKHKQDADIFFPGSDSYRLKNLDDKIWKDHVLVGYNRLALMVPKGNPKRLSDDLKQLTDNNLSVVIASPVSGAVGGNSKKLLDQAGITKDVYMNVTYFTSDSLGLFNAIKKGHADITLNWYAVAKWPNPKAYMDAIPLAPEIAPPKKLELNLMTTSKNPELALKFMQYASSEKGLKTFAEYGFLTDLELTQLLQASH